MCLVLHGFFLCHIAILHVHQLATLLHKFIDLGHGIGQQQLEVHGLLTQFLVFTNQRSCIICRWCSFFLAMTTVTINDSMLIVTSGIGCSCTGHQRTGETLALAFGQTCMFAVNLSCVQMSIVQWMVIVTWLEWFQAQTISRRRAIEDVVAVVSFRRRGFCQVMRTKSPDPHELCVCL